MFKTPNGTVIYDDIEIGADSVTIWLINEGKDIAGDNYLIWKAWKKFGYKNLEEMIEVWIKELNLLYAIKKKIWIKIK